MEQDRRLHDLREWLEKVSQKTGLKLTPLANHIGVSPSTLTRIPKPDYKGMPLASTIAKLAEVSGIPAPPSIMGGLRAGFDDVEIVPFAGQSILAADNLRNGQDTWTVNTDLMDLQGILPGTQIVIDLNLQPRSGDIVLAQIYGAHGTAETVLRMFDSPYLVCSSTRRNVPKPVYVDNDKVVIMGVLVKSWRDWQRIRKSA